MRPRISSFLNFFKKNKPQVGDKVLCIKNYKFIKEVTRSDADYVTKSKDNQHIIDLVKGPSYLFQEGNHYEVLSVRETGIDIEGEGGVKQTFLFESNISKYETQYFPIFSDYFELG